MREICNILFGETINKIYIRLLIHKSYASSGVLTIKQFDIMQFRGIRMYGLPHFPEKLSVLKITREGLSFELRKLLYLAKKLIRQFKKKMCSSLGLFALKLLRSIGGKLV